MLPYFQGKTLNHHSTARIALKLVLDTETYLRHDITYHASSNVPVEDTNLSVVTASLPQDCVIVFSDVAFDKDTKISGIGLILTNISGDFIGCKLKEGTVRNAE